MRTVVRPSPSGNWENDRPCFARCGRTVAMTFSKLAYLDLKNGLTASLGTFSTSFWNLVRASAKFFISVDCCIVYLGDAPAGEIQGSLSLVSILAWLYSFGGRVSVS